MFSIKIVTFWLQNKLLNSYAEVRQMFFIQKNKFLWSYLNLGS